ncbi:unnamed protein product [Prunus armeniaca]
MGAEVYHPNFYARQLGCPQLIPLKSYRSCNRAASWRDADDLEVHKDARCAVNKINNGADALYPSWECNSCSSAEFDAWWKPRFRGLPASITALKVLFCGWNSWTVYTEVDAKNFMMQTIKDINAQIIEVSSVISAGDLVLPSADEKDKAQTEQTTVEATPPARRKRKETAPVQDNAAQPEISAKSPPPPPIRSKRLRKRTVVKYVAMKETAAAPTTTSRIDEELREAFEAVEQEKELEEEQIPAKVIVESIALAQKQQENLRASWVQKCLICMLATALCHMVSQVTASTNAASE